MSWGDLAGAGLAGLAAGMINVVVGSGTLVTFPALVALGVPPVAANATSTVGLVFGSLSGSYGYRNELVSRWAIVRRLVPAVCVGAAFGSLLVLAAPPQIFEAVVPLLILGATALLVAQPLIARRVKARIDASSEVDNPAQGRQRSEDRNPGDTRLLAATAGAGVYGGYFGAGLGIVMLAVLGTLHPDELQGTNAVKNALSAAANLLAAVIFAFSGEVRWALAGAVALGALVGGHLGALLGRRIPDRLLRTVMAIVGLLAAASVLMN